MLHMEPPGMLQLSCPTILPAVAEGEQSVAEYLHEMEVTHRDLKPENLLLQHSVQGLLVKIVDFGLSNTHDGGSLLQTACGSPCYAAPEMIAGLKYWGPKADIWSMGVILYALVCGYLPFEDSNTSVLYKKIMAGKYTCPSWISPDVCDLISRILATDPVQRYSISDIRRHRWFSKVSKATQIELQPKALEMPDPVVLSEIESIGIQRATVVDGLKRGLHNNATTTYHLLLKRITRNAELAAGRPVSAYAPRQHQPMHEVGTRMPSSSPASNVPKLKLPVSAKSMSIYNPDEVLETVTQPDETATSHSNWKDARASTSRPLPSKRPASAGANFCMSHTDRSQDLPTSSAPPLPKDARARVVSPMEVTFLPQKALPETVHAHWPLFGTPPPDAILQQRPSSRAHVNKSGTQPASNNSVRYQKAPLIETDIMNTRRRSHGRSPAVLHHPARPNGRHRTKESSGGRGAILASNLTAQ